MDSKHIQLCTQSSASLNPYTTGVKVHKISVFLINKNLKPNTEESSCNNCCSGKAITITYSESVIIALGIQNAMCMHHIVTCDLPHYNIFPHYLINGLIKKKSYRS